MDFDENNLDDNNIKKLEAILEKKKEEKDKITKESNGYNEDNITIYNEDCLIGIDKLISENKFSTIR